MLRWFGSGTAENHIIYICHEPPLATNDEAGIVWKYFSLSFFQWLRLRRWDQQQILTKPHREPSEVFFLRQSLWARTE